MGPVDVLKLLFKHLVSIPSASKVTGGDDEWGVTAFDKNVISLLKCLNSLVTPCRPTQPGQKSALVPLEYFHK